MGNGKTMRHLVLTVMNFGTVGMHKNAINSALVDAGTYILDYTPSRPTRS